MPIFSFVQTKGGTGKTTLSQAIAYSKVFKKTFGEIAMVELDPQGTLADWIEERAENKRATKHVHFYQLASIELTKLTKELEKIVATHEAVILDVPGESVGGFPTQLALNLSDLVLIPMRTSTNDEASFARNLWPVIQEGLKENRAAIVIVPSFIHPQTSKANVKNYFAGIMPEEIGCLKNFLPFRSTFENYSRDGMTLAEYTNSVKNNARLHDQAKKAAKDMENIAKEIVSQTR